MISQVSTLPQFTEEVAFDLDAYCEGEVGVVHREGGYLLQFCSAKEAFEERLAYGGPEGLSGNIVSSCGSLHAFYDYVIHAWVVRYRYASNEPREETIDESIEGTKNCVDTLFLYDGGRVRINRCFRPQLCSALLNAVTAILVLSLLCAVVLVVKYL